MTVSRDGTESMDPSIDFARAMKTFPYSQGCSEGSAIAGCVENLSRSAHGHSDISTWDGKRRTHETCLAAIPAIQLSKKLDPVRACTFASRSLRSIQGNCDPKCTIKTEINSIMTCTGGIPSGPMTSSSGCPEV